LNQFASQLAALGWDSYFEEKFKNLNAEGATPARVIADYGANYLVHDGNETRRATTRRVNPGVGDWVALKDGLITAIAERRTAFSRKAAGAETKEQILAANVDVAFVVAAATDVNPRRIERFLTIAWQSGATPTVVLTKADVAESADAIRNELESVGMGTPVVVTSSITGDGIDEIANQLVPARTAVLLGPSGAGKSSLINRILGSEVMRTREVHRSSGEGRHMTSHRQLVQLPKGGMIIDTPGLREAQLWEGEDALGNIFQDIEELALRCRFSDCAHQTEPDCAVKAAMADLSLDPKRLASYRKLQRELRAVAAKTDARIRSEDRKKWKQVSMANRASMK
jgi:ribosome biogenesis GTPase